jgi:hypothetical protein
LKKDLFLHWTSVIRKGQYWRLLTTFLCFGGKFDLMSLVDLFFIAQSGARMEFGRTTRFIVAIAACLAPPHPLSTPTGNAISSAGLDI